MKPTGTRGWGPKRIGRTGSIIASWPRLADPLPAGGEFALPTIAGDSAFRFAGGFGYHAGLGAGPFRPRRHWDGRAAILSWLPHHAAMEGAA